MAKATAEYKEKREMVVKHLPHYYGEILKAKKLEVDIKRVYNVVCGRVNDPEILNLLTAVFITG